MLGPTLALAIGRGSIVTLHVTASDSSLLCCCRAEAQVRLISLGPCWPGICSNPGSVIARTYSVDPLPARACIVEKRTRSIYKKEGEAKGFRICVWRDAGRQALMLLVKLAGACC
jgi:hypothetical protein